MTNVANSQNWRYPPSRRAITTTRPPNIAQHSGRNDSVARMRNSFCDRRTRTLIRICHQWRDTLQHWTTIPIRHCPQPSFVLLWKSLPRRPLAGSSPSSAGMHIAQRPTWHWQLKSGDGGLVVQASKAILAQKLRTVEADLRPMNLGLATCSGPIGLAESCGNGYVVSDTLLKKRTRWNTPVWSSEPWPDLTNIADSVTWYNPWPGNPFPLSWNGFPGHGLPAHQDVTGLDRDEARTSHDAWEVTTGIYDAVRYVIM